MMQDRSVNFYDVQRAFNEAWGDRPYKRGYGYKQYKRWEAFWEPRVYPHGIRPPQNYVWKQHLAFQRKYGAGIQKSNGRNANLWTSMGPYNWTSSSYNPGNGRINAVAEDPNDPNTLYVGAPSGGCWKSTDGGQTWAVLTDQLQALGVSAIAIDYTNSNVIYLGTGDDDGGDTYSIGVLKSVDGGQSWNALSLGNASLFGTRIYRILIHPTDNNTVFVASSLGLYKSSDAGNNWVRLRTGRWRDLELKPGDPQTIYLSNTTFSMSTDGGSTWTTTNTGLPRSSDINRAEIAVSPDDPNVVYFLAGDAFYSSFYGLYRSTNSGTSFTLQANSPNVFAYDATGADTTSGQSWYDMALCVAPDDANEVYVGGINVWSSTDGGVTFDLKSHWYYPPGVAYTHADIHVLEKFGNRLYCGSDGGIFKSTDDGTTFADLSDGLSITQFYRIAGTELLPNKLAGGTQDNGCNLISNNSALHTNGGDGMEVLMSPFDSNLVITSSQYGNFSLSTDGGYSSIPIFTGPRGTGNWITPMVMHPADDGFLLAGYDQVYMSFNRGITEQPLSNFSAGQGNIRNLALAPSAPITHFYASTSTVMYRTTDSGTNWVDVSAGLPNNSISSITVHPTNPLKIWVTFSGISPMDKVYTSDDGGDTWVNITKNLPNIPVNCMIYQNNSDDGIYIGTDVGVYYTDTMLYNWQPFMNGLPNVIVRDFEIHYGTGKIRAGTYGRGIWEADLKAPLITAPVANFSYRADGICVGDSVAFEDRSLDLAPGWQWHFPGGSPSTSTLANPKVVYPTAGLYSATLVVQNANGVDSIQKVVAVDYNPNILTVTLQLDSMPSDISWFLTNSSGVTVASSPLFALSNQVGVYMQRSVCLDTGCYEFLIRDLGGDGLCCANGQGYYLLTDANGDTLAWGDAFGSTDTATFCMNQTRPLSIAAFDEVLRCGATGLDISIGSIGGEGGTEYRIDGGAYQASNVFTNVGVGTYAIDARDVSGQIASTTVTITAAPAPTAVATTTSTTVYLNQGGGVNLFGVNSSNASSYLWTFADGSTSTLRDPMYTFVNGGTEDVILTVTKDNCTDSDTLTMTIIDNINVNKINQGDQLAINPNPVRNKVVVELDLAKQQEQVTLVIHNASGQQVYWQEFSDVQQRTINIHLGNEPQGIYVVTVLGDGLEVSKKLVKQ
jgi:PKD repeat protein